MNVHPIPLHQCLLVLCQCGYSDEWHQRAGLHLEGSACSVASESRKQPAVICVHIISAKQPTLMRDTYKNV